MKDKGNTNTIELEKVTVEKKKRGRKGKWTKFYKEVEQDKIIDELTEEPEDTSLVYGQVDTLECLGIKDGSLEPVQEEEFKPEEIDAETAEKIEAKEKDTSQNSPAIVIDREEENRDVIEFQKTGDMKILEKIYKNRIPTLKTWTRQHYYPGLTLSPEDLFEEFSCVLVKAAEKYEAKRGVSFNTCLFTFLLNRVKNIKSSKYAKKRIADEYSGPISGMILSLDFTYNDSDGSQVTLKDIIASPETKEDGHISKKAFFEETLNILSASASPEFKDFLVKISEGGSVTALIKEYKMKTGSVKISNAMQRKLNKRKSKKIVSDLIKNEVNNKFKLISYTVDKNSINYEIELNKTKETDKIMKTIRDLRKNKEIYIGRIKGLK